MPLLDRLRTKGWRMTPQRRVVAEVFDDRGGHFSAEEVHALAQARLPEVSLATVYNTLNELASMGELLVVTAAGGPKRFDANVEDHHQHLVCVQCQRVVDVHPSGEAHLTLSARERHGYDVHEVEVVFKGRCPDCRSL